MSHSENKPKSTQTTSNVVTNLNIQDTEGVTVVGDGNIVSSTDYGAINAALDIGVEALQMGQSNLQTAADLAGRGLDTALDFASRALDTTDSAVRSNEAIASESMQRIAEFGGVALGESFGFARDVVSGAGSAVADAVRTNIEGLQSLARQTSEGADDKVAKIAMYAVIGVVAALALPAMFKGARA